MKMRFMWTNNRSCMTLMRWFVYSVVGGSLTCFLGVFLLFPATIKVSYGKYSLNLRVYTADTTDTLSTASDALIYVKSSLGTTHSNTVSSNSPIQSVNVTKNTTPIQRVNVTRNITSIQRVVTKNIASIQSVNVTQNITSTQRVNVTKNTTPIQRVNVTRNMLTVQTSTATTFYLDVMPTLASPSDIAPKKTANYSVCVVLMGGLGNQMFQFAAMYGLAAKKGMCIVIGGPNELTKVFKLDVKLKENYRNVCKTFVGRGESLNCGYDKRMASFPANNNYRVGAYLQSWMYFYNASKSLRKQFVFKDDITESKNKVIHSVLRKHNFTSRSNVTLIGVHIRRGDLVDHKFGYQVASESYINKSVHYFLAKQLKNVIFLICSNGMAWTKENMPKGIRSEYIEGNSPAVDMAILGSCDHMISSVGTFSWWSAWLTGGEVTFYQWPAKEGSNLRKQFSKDYIDYFHPGWTGFS
ncbi:galactoside alpha-(1,2)-fucosyltransferase 2-like [Argopecten irradians]|uniref:galactoside alpha-(1,2)-fucosyltransferase 2-like n=1 Tax=Argopecten irradians TaxID=31199 RepID=UPI003712E075